MEYPLTILLLFVVGVTVFVSCVGLVKTIKGHNRMIRKARDTQRRLDEIDVVIGEGFVPDPPPCRDCIDPGPIGPFPGEADIARQMEELRREVGE